MFDKLAEVEARFDALTEQLSDLEVVQQPQLVRKLAKERAELEDVVTAYREYKGVLQEIGDSRELMAGDDEEFRELAREELAVLEKRQSQLEKELKLLLLPCDPNDEKNILLEIRAGTGGEEAALFAADLFRMFVRYAEDRRWKVELMNSHLTGTGGFKEVIALVEGRGAYSRLKYESGVHRVQRVPQTESQGRIHTSACTVAVLPEAEEIEVDIDDSDLRVDVYRSSGPGGQSVNTTDSAVRINHLPTGLVVTCQDEKSQHKNKARAMKILRARLLEKMQEEQQRDRSAARRAMVKSGDRSEKIRTYNFPQNRVTDHRIGLTLYHLDHVMLGELDPIIDALAAHYQTEALKVVESG